MSESSRRPLAGRPTCALLDSYGYVFLAGDDKDATGHGLMAGADNHTTAQTFTTKTGTIKVTFVFADLPCLSYFYVRCIDLSASPFKSEPKIVWSTENLALLSLDVSTSVGPHYFIYRAGRGRRPSLDPLPEISSHFVRWRINPYLVGVLPVDGGTDFVLAAFRREPGQYMLDVFRSKQGDWITELLVPDLPCWLPPKRKIVSPSKVIALQGGLLGFVDLWNGILLCNVLEFPVRVCFVPLPKLLPSNQEHYNESEARPICDVTCIDGLIIRCVELEDVYNSKTGIRDISTRDLYFDSEAVDPTQGVVEELDGWRLITWSREISWDYWRKGSLSHADELRTLCLPRPDYGGDGATESPLRTLKTSCPSVCGDDIVCLMSKNSPEDHDAGILTVDLKNKTMGEPVPYNAKRSRHSDTTYIPCTLKKYVNSESGNYGDTSYHICILQLKMFLFCPFLDYICGQ
jgi:hypothetical protein